MTSVLWQELTAEELRARAARDAIVILPVVYGIIGAITLLISAWIYNVAARITGGIEIEV